MGCTACIHYILALVYALNSFVFDLVLFKKLTFGFLYYEFFEF